MLLLLTSVIDKLLNICFKAGFGKIRKSSLPAIFKMKKKPTNFQYTNLFIES